MKKKIIGIEYKGIKNDAYRANAYALKCMIVSFLVLLFSWILDLLNIFIVDIGIMNTATGGAAIICLVAFFYAFFVGIDSKSSCYVVMLLLVAMATVICMELAYHTTMFMMFPLVCSAQYFDRKISLFTAVTTCVGCAVAVMIGYRVGLCDSNMLLLTYTTSAFHSEALASGNFTINTSSSLMFLFFVFPKWLIVLAMMPLLNHVAKDIQERTAREAMAKHMAEMDGLTGIYNRTKYHNDIRNKYSCSEKVAVIYLDINNLKETNDVLGHESGDILICGLADTLKDAETENCRGYRLGGDEFVILACGEDAENPDMLLEKFRVSLQNKPLEQNLSLSVAMGMAFGKGNDIELLVNAADENMYKNKMAMKAAGTGAGQQC